MELLDKLLVQTHSGDYTEIVDTILEELKTTEAKVWTQKISPTKANVMALWGESKLLINCHMDTVPPNGDWSVPSYELTKKGEKLYGLGTSDTKGNLYAILTAVKACSPKDSLLLFSVDEENGCVSGVTHFLADPIAKKVGKALVCEPTGLETATSHPGYCSFMIDTHSEGGHSSIGAVNPIVKTAELILKLEKNGFNIGTVSGGQRGNIVPSSCSMKVSKRSMTSTDVVNADLLGLVGQPGVKVTSSFSGPPLTGMDAHDEGVHVEFWTEAALFEAAGIPVVVFGAGNIEQAHAPDEYVPIDQLEAAVEHFIALMEAKK